VAGGIGYFGAGSVIGAFDLSEFAALLRRRRARKAAG
jgi:hypothetical protein